MHLAAGAEPLSKNLSGFTPADYARRNGFTDLALLIENIATARSVYHLSDELAEATRE